MIVHVQLFFNKPIVMGLLWSLLWGHGEMIASSHTDHVEWRLVTYMKEELLSVWGLGWATLQCRLVRHGGSSET